MDKSEFAKYWIDSSNNDYKAMLNLFKSKDYSWSLFIGHLVMEKLLKALYVRKVDSDIPKTHDLLRLAEKSLLDLDENKKDLLDLITTFNINARYPDYKHSFYKKCTHDFALENIKKIKELRIWILSLLKN